MSYPADFNFEQIKMNRFFPKTWRTLDVAPSYEIIQTIQLASENNMKAFQQFDYAQKLTKELKLDYYIYQEIYKYVCGEILLSDMCNYNHFCQENNFVHKYLLTEQYHLTHNFNRKLLLKEQIAIAKSKISKYSEALTQATANLLVAQENLELFEKQLENFNSSI